MYCINLFIQKCVTALEKTWHTEHFFCAQCGKQFGEEGFHEKDGRPYCRDDYFDMFAPKCGGCNRPIMENYVSALSTQWHADCFVCRVIFLFFKYFFLFISTEKKMIRYRPFFFCLDWKTIIQLFLL